jgi:hypothetical protein
MNQQHLDRRFLLGGMAGVAGVSALAAMARGGPLAPPAGAVSPTGKTLTSVEPRTEINTTNTPGLAGSVFTISQPGSYYLSGDINVPAGMTAIGVYGAGVTIDLNGFAIRNVTGQGIVYNGGVKGVTVCNGFFVNCSANLINGFIAPNTVLRDIQAVDCTGLTYLGDRALVERCILTGAVNEGLVTGAGSIVRDCVVTGSATGYPGISVGAGGFSVSVGPGGLVERCVVSGFGRGVQIGSGSVRGCTLLSNTIGIQCTGATVVEGNLCDGNGTGILVDASTGRCRVADNHVSRSTGTAATTGGIVINQSGCVVEANSMTGNYTNLRVTSAFGLIVRNRMSFPGAGGNSVIAANNSVGTMVNAASGGSPVTTDANANVIF